jgi:tetratricopeptide (TPR) repeat protein
LQYCDPLFFILMNHRLFQLVWLWLVVAAVVAQALPELPRLNVENFAAEIRTQVQTAYQQAQAKPRDAAAAGQLGMILHAYEQYDFATPCYARARQLAPQEARWSYYEALAQSALGRHAEAIALLQTVLRVQPNNLPAQLRLAEVLLAAGRHRECQPLFEALTKQATTRAQALVGWGQSQIASGDVAVGVTHLREALTLFPTYGQAHYALGLALRDQGQISEAKEHLSLSQQYNAQRPPLNDPLLAAIAELNASATDWMARGVAFAGLGQLDNSIRAHERALAINPKLVQAHINLISLYARSGQTAKAEAHYHAAVAVNPNLADSHFNYGIVLMGLARYADAAAAFQRSLERNPFQADAHYNYAIIIERDGKLDEAAAHYRQALANDPGHRLTHFHYARILVMQDKLSEAIEHLQQTITVDDEDTPRFLYALGATYARAGDRTKALQYLRAAQKRAEQRGQTEIAAAITRDLQRLEGKE